MTVTLELKPETQAGLSALASAAGMSLEEYVLAMIESTAFSQAPNTLSAEQRAAAFEGWSAGHRHTPPLSDYAVSRESTYEDCDR
jgi:hypothetical protein